MLRCLDPILTVAAAADAPILHRALPLRAQVQDCRSEIGVSTLSDSVTDVLVVNSIVRDYVVNDPYNQTPRTPQTDLLIPHPQPPSYARHVPSELINWRTFDVMRKYKAQFFDVLLSSGWQVAWKSQQEEHLQWSLASNNNNTSSYSGGRKSFFVDFSSASENAHEIELIKAVVSCSLYPNLALGDSFKKGKKWNSRTKNLSRVPLGNSAVATSLRKEDIGSALHSRIFTYRSILDIGTGEFLEDVNHTNIWALLLLAAGDDHITFSPSFGIGMIDGWLLFKSDAETMAALKTTRQLLNRCFGRLLRQSFDDMEKTKKVLGEVREVIKIVLCNENAERLEGNDIFFKEGEQQQIETGAANGNSSDAWGVVGGDDDWEEEDLPHEQDA
jgi:hypothetical protein